MGLINSIYKSLDINIFKALINECKSSKNSPRERMWTDNLEKKWKSLIKIWKNKCLIVSKGIQIKTIIKYSLPPMKLAKNP